MLDTEEWWVPSCGTGFDHLLRLPDCWTLWPPGARTPTAENPTTRVSRVTSVIFNTAREEHHEGEFLGKLAGKGEEGSDHNEGGGAGGHAGHFDVCHNQ